MSSQINAREICPYAKWCGGCSLQHIPYADQLKYKQHQVESLLGGYCAPEPIVGMNYPYYYRTKVHAVFGGSVRGRIICGTYERGSHQIVNIDACQIDDRSCDAIIMTVKDLLKSFKIDPYNEDTGRGILRHVLVRRAEGTGEIMVILVTAGETLPSKKKLAAALVSAHPKITTVIQNINDGNTSMVLGSRNEVISGPGYIEDRLLGCRFRISPGAFYQVNGQQMKKLYRLAIEMAALRGGEHILDAYCGTGTIGIAAARSVLPARDLVNAAAAANASRAGRDQASAKRAAGRGQQSKGYRRTGEDAVTGNGGSSARSVSLTGVELNQDAIHDARVNARLNHLQNARFIAADAGEFMQQEAAAGHRYDVVIMDPPRSGSSEAFTDALLALAPERIVYVSCNPKTQARDLARLKRCYRVVRNVPVDMFPFTDGIECVAALERSAGRGIL